MTNKNPVEVLKENGFIEVSAEDLYDVESEDYFYIIDNKGDTHYFKSK